MSGPWVPVVHAAVAGRADEADTIEAAERVCDAVARAGFRSEVIALGLDLTCFTDIAVASPHVVFNMVEAIDGSGKLLPLAPLVLEHLGIPFTGVGAEAAIVTGSKILTKQALRAHGIPTPDWWERGPAEADAVIVKSVWEHGSLGIDCGSVVAGANAAFEVASREARFGGRFFAEAYIEGREFNVALLDGEVLPIPEMTFTLPVGRPAIVDFEAKWMEESVAYRGANRRFGLERTDGRLASRLADTARACWAALGLSGYARVDFRVGDDGVPQVLEVNANPGLGRDAGFVAAAEAAGLSFDDLVIRILQIAEQGRRAAA